MNKKEASELADYLGEIVGSYIAITVFCSFIGLIFWGLLTLIGFHFSYIQVTAAVLILILIKNILFK